jgi:hypothetical protein
VKAKPRTVAQLLADMPVERRREVSRVRAAVRKHLPQGYQEVVEGQVIVYQVPLARANHNGRPLWYAALAAPKSYLTLHLMPVYASPALLERLKAGFAAAGKKLDIGKACIRYQRARDLDLDAIGAVVASLPMEKWIATATAAWKR